MKILLLIALLATSAFAQKWELIGTSVANPYKMPVAYFVDMDSVVTKGNETRFVSVMTGVDDSESFLISTSTLVVFSDISANCSTLQWKLLSRRGADEGTLINETYDKPTTREAGAGTVIYEVMQRVCPKPKLKLTAYINF
jgi:hypothetical protein